MSRRVTSLEIPSLATYANKFAPVGSLGIIRNAMAFLELASLVRNANKLALRTR